MDTKTQQQIIKALNRPPRFHNRTYEMRARINGIDIYACASNPDECAARFMDDLSEKIFAFSAFPNHGGKLGFKLPTNFHEFATYFFENVKKRKTVERTYQADMNRYKNHIQPRFASLPLRLITTDYCQAFVDELTAKGIERTRDDVISLMNGIFNYAVDRGVLIRNPMKPVVFIPHERVHGVPLTLEEEKLLFDATAETEFQYMFAVALYTGMRPNEYRTAHFDGNIIVAKNSKRKNAVTGKIQWKRIPICPMLAPFLENIDVLDMYAAETLREKFKTIFPNHTLKDLRTTFYTRCETCGVSDKARDEMVGHERDKLHEAYSKLPDEYLIAEANKLSYPLEVTATPKLPPKNNRYGLAEKLKNAKKPPENPEN